MYVRPESQRRGQAGPLQAGTADEPGGHRPRRARGGEKAAACSEAIDGAPAAAIELADGSIVTGKNRPAAGRGIPALLNALKRLAGIDQEIDLVSSSKAIEPIQQLKTTYLGSKNPPPAHGRDFDRPVQLGLREPHRRRGYAELPKLRGCDIHTTVILSGVTSTR